MRPPAALLLLVLLVVAVLCSAFVPPCPSSSSSRSSRCGALRMKAEAEAGLSARGGLERRGALAQAAALPLLAGALLTFTLPAAPSRAAAKAQAGATFEETMATLILAKELLKPVKRYIEIGQFDPARTNIKYVVNQLRIKKAMERAVLLAFDKSDADPSKLDEAAEVTAVVDNELSQLDSSVYTQIFIPSDGEINPTALKYRDQAFGFYDTVIHSFDAVLALASPADLAAADTLAGARRTQLQKEAPFLFKSFSGDFYRPATP